MSDRIPVKIHDMTVKISPLSYDVKSACQSLIMNGNHMEAAVYALKNSIKEIDGLENEDGSKYQLQFSEGQISQDSIDEILNVPGSDEMQLVAISLLQGIPKEFVDPGTGKKLTGVEFLKEPSRKKARSRK